jgi:leader peptidase (prepilin peptidase)/N-methyltransferase
MISLWVLGMEALGLGDVTLMAMIGSFLGWQPIVFVFLLAPLCGIVMALVLWLTRRRRAVPYGPFLSAAAVLVLFTWRWLWTPTREIFGHWPTLVALAVGVTGGMAALLGLLRLYRAIPVERRGEDRG